MQGVGPDGVPTQRVVGESLEQASFVFFAWRGGRRLESPKEKPSATVQGGITKHTGVSVEGRRKGWDASD
jgi:hypothetical protein